MIIDNFLKLFLLIKWMAYLHQKLVVQVTYNLVFISSKIMTESTTHVVGLLIWILNNSVKNIYRTKFQLCL